MFRKGDVVIAKCPYSDGTGAKPRPVVVLSRHMMPHADVLAAEVTTKEHPNTVPIREANPAGVRPGSRVKIRVITVNVPPSAKRIGALAPQDLVEVSQRIKELF